MVVQPAAPAPERGGGRRARSPGLTTFVVVDVILVLTFLVLLAMNVMADGGESGDGGTSADAGQTSSATPEPETDPQESAPAEPVAAEAVAEFQLPSGNIFCSMTDTSATCTILAFSYTAPELPAGCAGTVGNVLTVTAADGAAMPCVTTPPTGAVAGTPVLEYGQASTVGEMTCQSSPNGVYCQHDPTRTGFSVAKAGYRLF